MIKVARVSHAELRTRDPVRLGEFYTAIFGLVPVGRDADRMFLATQSGQLALVLRQASEAGCSHVTYQAAPQTDLGDLAKSLQAKGIANAPKSDPAPGIRQTVTFADASGTTIELFNQSELVQSQQRSASAIAPLKLGHVAFKVTDLEAAQRFYLEVLGFRVSDWRNNIFAFLRCGPDHHTVNLVHGSTPKLHHLAFELRDGSALLAACDYLGVNGYQIAWGPGRHIIGGNMFIYVRNPDSSIMELYADMAQMKNEDLGAFELRPWHWDRPYRPKDWPVDTLSNLWGPPSPPGFREG
jgi:catechol-2,3-dioxygenase